MTGGMFLLYGCFEDLRQDGFIQSNPALYYGKVGEKMKFIVSTPKTQSGKREIPLMMDVRRQLAKQREYDRLTGTTGNARIEGYTDFVFHTFKGMPFTTAGINSLIGRIIDSYNDQERARAEEEGQKPELLPKFSAHILRHTFCTRFCENESNIKVIQEIMGHHDIKTTMDITVMAALSQRRSGAKSGTIFGTNNGAG